MTTLWLPLSLRSPAAPSYSPRHHGVISTPARYTSTPCPSHPVPTSSPHRLPAPTATQTCTHTAASHPRMDCSSLSPLYTGLLRTVPSLHFGAAPGPPTSTMSTPPPTPVHPARLDVGARAPPRRQASLPAQYQLFYPPLLNTRPCRGRACHPPTAHARCPSLNSSALSTRPKLDGTTKGALVQCPYQYQLPTPLVTLSSTAGDCLLSHSLLFIPLLHTFLFSLDFAHPRAQAVCLDCATTARQHPPHALPARCLCRLARGLNCEPTGAYTIPRDPFLPHSHPRCPDSSLLFPPSPSSSSDVLPLSIDSRSPCSLFPSLSSSCMMPHTPPTATHSAAASMPSFPLPSLFYLSIQSNPILLIHSYLLTHTPRLDSDPAAATGLVPRCRCASSATAPTHHASCPMPSTLRCPRSSMHLRIHPLPAPDHRAPSHYFIP
ncbi:hypothetical protein B0H14DRAFT_3525374 [Mycena olivaceomarginata]|nr:hypothetical protein B0H14DRAFT_3525374 [Mycena olivaceomarginata]